MTLSSEVSRVTYTGNGVTTAFAYAFPIPESSHVKVVLTVIATGVETELSTTQYSISGIGSSVGGSVTYPLIGSPLASTSTISIRRILPYTQDVDIINQGGFLPEVVEGGMDRIVMMLQQLAAQGFLPFRGTYAAGTTYVIGDIVLYNGSSWVAIQTTVGNVPPTLPTTSNDYWLLSASKGDTGSTGPTGPTGPAGPTGPQGVQAGIQLTFDTTTADADPGAGKIRFNHATFASITQLYIDNTDAGAGDITAWLDLFDDSTTTTNRGFLRFEKSGSPTIWRTFRVSGAVVDGTGYRKVPVTPVSEAGVLANGDALVAEFARTGDKGSDGAGAGDVVGPASAVDGQFVKFDSTTGKLIKAGATTIGTTEIATDAVTYAKIQNVSATDKLLGRATAGAGDVEEIACTSAGRALLDDANAAAQRVTLGFDDTGTVPAVNDAFKWNGTNWVPKVTRETLTATRTYYVRTDGSDANSGLVDNAGGAFLTIQKAINVVAALDISIYNVTIQVRDGTYTGTNVVTGPWIGSGNVTILGNTGTPANVIVQTTASANGVIQALAGARIIISGFEIRATGGIGIGLYAENGARISFGAAMRFGACTNYHVNAGSGGSVYGRSAYTIAGNASIHLFSSDTGYIDLAGITVTLTGTPALSSAYAVSDRLSLIVCHACTFSGAATGPRYSISANSVVFTNGGGATYLPGNSAGATASGGQYI